MLDANSFLQKEVEKLEKEGNFVVRRTTSISGTVEVLTDEYNKLQCR